MCRRVGVAFFPGPLLGVLAAFLLALFGFIDHRATPAREDLVRIDLLDPRTVSLKTSRANGEGVKFSTRIQLEASNLSAPLVFSPGQPHRDAVQEALLTQPDTVAVWLSKTALEGSVGLPLLEIWGLEIDHSLVVGPEETLAAKRRGYKLMSLVWGMGFAAALLWALYLYQASSLA